MTGQIIDWATASPEALREHAARQIARDADPLPENARFSRPGGGETFRGGVLCHPLVSPAQGDIVYFHGGGFVTGSPEQRRGTTAWIAALTARRVLSCSYRLAPEHDWRAMAGDAAQALRFAIGHRLSATPLVLAADSAGVSVALWGYRRLTPGEQSRIGAFLFFYGAFGDPRPPSAQTMGTAANGLNVAALTAMYARVGGDAPRVGRDAASDVVPSLVVVGDRDPLVDETLGWHRAAMRGAPAATCVVLPGQHHGFLRRAGRDGEVRTALRKAGHWLDDVLA